MQSLIISALLISICVSGKLSGSENSIDSSSIALERFKARLLYSAMLAGDWLVNNQNRKTLWESEYFNGDYGRWIYEYKPEDGFWRGSVCWTTATGIMDLLTLYERTGFPRYKEALERAAVYLKSLQILDSRVPRNYHYRRLHGPLPIHRGQGVSRAGRAIR